MDSLFCLADKYVSVNLGFSLEETMSGHVSFENDHFPSGQHPMKFTIRWGPADIMDWLNPGSDGFLRHPLRGSVTIGGLCDDTEVRGYMELRYFSERVIRYVFNFEVNDTPYQFYGEKSNLRISNLHRTHTTLNGRITDKSTDETIGQATLYFYWSNLPDMIMSLRLN